MEDPTTFDIWGVVCAGRESFGVEFLAAQFPLSSRIEVLKRIHRSRGQHEKVKLAGDVGWTASTRIVSEVQQFAVEVVVYQSGYTPQDEARMSWCNVHRVFYGGCVGCPVCGGWSAE